MKIKLETPQEVEVWYLIPAIKRELVMEMIKEGLKQSEVAKIVGMSDAAISQYMHNKRASATELPGLIISEVHKAARSLVKKESEYKSELQRIMKLIWGKQYICSPCRTHTGAANTCQVCYQ